MPVVFNDGKKNNEQPKNDIIPKIVSVIQKLEEEIISNKRTVNSKINGNNFSVTEKLRELVSTIDSIDTRVSVIGERTPEEMTTEPIRQMISEGYTSIQIKGSADLLGKTVELMSVDQSLSMRIDEEVIARESVVLSLATDIVSLDERNQVKHNEIKSRLDDINMSPSSPNYTNQIQNTITSLTNEISSLKKQNEELSAKLDRELFVEMNNRIKMNESINNRFMFGS